MGVVMVGSLFKEVYQVQEKLGEGGMAQVFKANHVQMGYEVALKLLLPHLASEITVQSRFISEAHIQSHLQHPHIAQVYDVIQEAGVLGFAMEWCDQGDLRVWMKQSTHAPTREQWRTLFLPVVSAMAHAHEQGVVHRDLKPSNILLASQHQQLCPKVGDFGIAKILGEAGHTRTGSMMGTLAYMSPEQLEDSKQVDHRTDIYSLGIILYQLATGRLPFSDTGPSVVLQIFREPPLPPDEAPKPLRPVILRCLEKEPGARYQSCHELYQALEKAFATGSQRIWAPAAYPEDMQIEGQTGPSESDELDVSTQYDGVLGAALCDTIPPDASFGGVPQAAPQVSWSEAEEETSAGDDDWLGSASLPIGATETKPTVETGAYEAGLVPPLALDEKATEEAPIPADLTGFPSAFAGDSLSGPTRANPSPSPLSGVFVWGLVVLLFACGSALFWWFDPLSLYQRGRSPVGVQGPYDAGPTPHPAHSTPEAKPSTRSATPPRRRPPATRRSTRPGIIDLVPSVRNQSP